MVCVLQETGTNYLSRAYRFTAMCFDGDRVTHFFSFLHCSFLFVLHLVLNVTGVSRVLCSMLPVSLESCAQCYRCLYSLTLDHSSVFYSVFTLSAYLYNLRISSF